MKSLPAISFAGSELSHPRHVCAFFNSEEESNRVLLPFICDGFTCGHKSVNLINPGQRPALLKRLRCEGIDTEESQEEGQLEIQYNVDVYLQDGRFDPDRMLKKFEAIANSNASSKFPLSRIVCQMDWAVDGRSDLTELIQFEARVNHLWSQHDDAVICVYDLAKFGGEAVVDIVRTHPMVVVGGLLQQNPFYVEPAIFLEELRLRRAKRERSPGASD
ncbi:hypothetical protein J2X72_003920 [Phyllobacterium sp. 1468]|uniref:MEDS domain-containing protein n=1 Tax=Phyllobacterium sp. 1468 TaxID=2817759 RepID=UPI00285AD7AB|nr:MEDS domain-containing protein [Phyllobacterium sp. 1468]MDR6635108.1 hypothetical protein [Phyllobacterium sp. 1468]